MSAIVTILVQFFVFPVITNKYIVVLHCHTVASMEGTFSRVILSASHKRNSADIKENISEMTDDSHKYIATSCVALVLQ